MLRTSTGLPRERGGIVVRARMRMLFRRATALVDAAAQAEGLSPAQYHALLALAAEGGADGMGESELVRHLDASRAHVSVLVRSLTDAGLVSGRRGPDDRRLLHLAVTDAGWELLDRVGSAQESALHAFVARLDPAEVRAIIDEISARYLRLLPLG